MVPATLCGRGYSGIGSAIGIARIELLGSDKCGNRSRMHRLLFLIPLIALAASCPKRDQMSRELPGGLLLTEPGETSLEEIPGRSNDPAYHENIRKKIEAGFKCLFVDVQNG